MTSRVKRERTAQETVRAGYDKASQAYRSDSGQGYGGSHTYDAWLDELAALLQPGAAILDLGCGCGVPVAHRLAAAGFAVTGVDISPVQIERAHRLVPQATLLCANMSSVSFSPASFSAVVAFYSLIHLPLVEQPPLLRRIRSWLQPGGYLMATVGATAWTGFEEDWLSVPGATMYWSHADAATYKRWLQESGLAILWTRFIPEGNGGHTLLLAQAT